MNKTIVTFGHQAITIEDVNRIAENNAVVALSNDDQFIHKINKGVEFLEKLLQQDGVIYGVTTGYGDSCNRFVPKELIHQLPIQLSRFHGCGLGEYFSPRQSRAIMAVRLASLAQGFSGVGFPLLQQIITFLNYDLAPLIPQEGSVGASGDLTPLSYLAAALMGEREVIYQQTKQQTSNVLKQLNLASITLKPKEALAVMNGTAVMTALACQAYERTNYLTRLAARLTAMATIALRGNTFHFDEKLFSVKPHAGQQQIAAWIAQDLVHQTTPRNSARVQDRYSIRCAPHVIGVLQDSLPWFRSFIENELNSANDNPIIDGEGEHVLHGGHFYGGHIACVMDTMKCQVANLADLLDRQMALLMDEKFNQGLPNNLSMAQGIHATINHGFKAVQIGVSAWTAEALKHTMPASVFSRSTECHNQDKVSMGTIAARDCLRVLQLTEQVFAAHLLALTQAISIRLQQHELTQNQIANDIWLMINDVKTHFDLVEWDRPLEGDLRKFIDFIQHQRWKLYE